MLKIINKDNLIVWIMIVLFYLALLLIIYIIIPFIFPPSTYLSNFAVLLIFAASLILAFFIANKIATLIYSKFFTHKKEKK